VRFLSWCIIFIFSDAIATQFEFLNDTHKTTNTFTYFELLPLHVRDKVDWIYLNTYLCILMYNNIYNLRTIFIRIVYGTFVIQDLCPKFEQCFPNTMEIKENAKGFYLFGCNCRSYHTKPTEVEETLRPCLPNRWHIHDFLQYIRRKKFSMWLYITVVFTLLIVQKILFF